MITDYIDHEEATIQSYMREPEFGEYMLSEALKEGDLSEARKVHRRLTEARRRLKAEGEYVQTISPVMA